MYLDHAGCTLYSQSQLRNHLEDLSSSLYGNPHSGNISSRATHEAVEFVRDLMLQHFKTDCDRYDVIFTSGCTGGLVLLGNMFPWRCASSDKDGPRGQQFEYITSDNHDTVGKCLNGGSTFLYNVCVYTQ